MIIDALVTHPASLRLLQALAVLQIRSQDLDKAAATVSRIAALDDPKARLAADGLRAQLLLAQGKTDESADFLQSLADSKAGGSSVLVAALEARLRAGDAEAASSYLDEQLACFRWYPESKSGAHFAKQFREDTEVAARYADGRHGVLLRKRVKSLGIVAAYRLLALGRSASAALSKS